MKAYKTIAAVHLSAGTELGLDDKQAATRSHLLIELGNGIYRAEQSMVFKAGEVIGLFAIPKGEAGLVEITEPSEVITLPDEQKGEVSLIKVTESSEVIDSPIEPKGEAGLIEVTGSSEVTALPDEQKGEVSLIEVTEKKEPKPKAGK